mgnify:CR=1 FL=1
MCIRDRSQIEEYSRKGKTRGAYWITFIRGPSCTSAPSSELRFSTSECRRGGLAARNRRFRPPGARFGPRGPGKRKKPKNFRSDAEIRTKAGASVSAFICSFSAMEAESVLRLSAESLILAPIFALIEAPLSILGMFFLVRHSKTNTASSKNPC